MVKQKDIRKFPRVEKICFTAVKRYDESGELEAARIGKTLNVSEGGILLETTNPLPFMAQVNLVFATDNDMLKIKGEVIRLDKKENGTMVMGIRFLQIDKRDLTTLREFIAAKD